MVTSPSSVMKDVVEVQREARAVFSCGTFETEEDKGTQDGQEDTDGSRPMSVRARVLKEPLDDKILRLVSSPLSVTNALGSFLRSLLLPTMYAEGGIGIAAIQVGLPIRAMIVDIPIVTSVDMTPVPPSSSDPRFVRKRVEEGKRVRVIESRTVYESLLPSDHCHTHRFESVLGSCKDPGKEMVVEIERKPMFIINPSLEHTSSETIILEEGCLSVPYSFVKEEYGTDIKVERSNGIRMKYVDENGVSHVLDIDGTKGEHEKWLVRCILHEYDHLEGILFTDVLLSKAK